MKRLFITLIALGLFNQCEAQEKRKSKTLYTVVYNATTGHSNIPLIGFVNVAKDSHKGAEIGFVNKCIGKLQGGQIGFINTAANKVIGAQIGFVNTTTGDLQGAQVGFVNTAASKIQGGQIGFVNTIANDINGGQIGFVNTARKKVTGSQIGFINYADEIESGVPVGFMSFVRRGGYKSIEVSTSEIYPVNLAFKTGVREFYTYVKGGYNPNAYNQFGIGAGLGTQIRLIRSLYYNPEVETMSSISYDDDDHYVSVVNSLRYMIGGNLEVAAGPAITWRRNVYGENNQGDLAWAYSYRINRRNDLILGLRLSASIIF